MAGDWIKMEACTPEKAEVLAITVKMGWDDADKTVGVLFRVWRWFDQHTTDGNANSVTSALLDRIIGVTGFCHAMESVGWLVIHDDGLSLPNFEFHNGKTAKSRAQGAKRSANFKSNAKGNGKSNGDSVTSALPREEKRREDNTNPSRGSGVIVELHPEQQHAAEKTPTALSTRFSKFWSAYPRKSGKGAAEKAWAKIKPDDALLATMLAAIAWQGESAEWLKDGGAYIPHPTTWLNAKRWEDEPSGVKAIVGNQPAQQSAYREYRPS